MNDEKYILDWYKNHIWTRPKPDKWGGVGMFAIRDIPKGTSIFDLADRSTWGWITWKDAKTIPHGVLNWILECQPQDTDKVLDGEKLFDKYNNSDKSIWAYTNEGMNWQTTWYFCNHSVKPSVSIFSIDNNPRLFRYIANRDIECDEELYENYHDFMVAWKLDT